MKWKSIRRFPIRSAKAMLKKKTVQRKNNVYVKHKGKEYRYNIPQDKLYVKE